MVMGSQREKSTFRSVRQRGISPEFVIKRKPFDVILVNKPWVMTMDGVCATLTFATQLLHLSSNI